MKVLMMTQFYNSRVQVPATVSAPAAVDDAVPLNRNRRDIADVANGVGANTNTSTPTGFLRPKKSINISTFNVRTAAQDFKIYELIANAELHKIDVICLQEHRHYHIDVDVRYKNFGKWTLVTSSCTKNSVNAAQGGVGFLISPKVISSLNYVSKISDRILVATFNSNPQLTLLSCYSPTLGSDIAEAEDFYEELIGTISLIPKHDFLMVGGDFNAQLGTESGRYTYHQDTNRNGALLESMMEQFNLRATNTRFQKRMGKLWTCKYANGSRGQIDFILVNRKWLNSVTNAEAYSSFVTVKSDHRIVTASIRLSVRANKPKVRSNIYKWEALRNDSTVCSQFEVSVKNRFEALSSEVNLDEPDVNSKLYDNMAQACKDAAEVTVPKRT